MNLSPDWIPLLRSREWEALHWSEVGQPNAPDSEIFAYARENRQVVLTQDLDFAQLLFATNHTGPSVVLLRVADEFDQAVRAKICNAIAIAAEELRVGALLTLSSRNARLRRLPIDPNAV